MRQPARGFRRTIVGQRATPCGAHARAPCAGPKSAKCGASARRWALARTTPVDRDDERSSWSSRFVSIGGGSTVLPRFRS